MVMFGVGSDDAVPDHGAFRQATAVWPGSAGQLHGAVHPDWCVADKPHGGYLLALATRAALSQVAEATGDPVAVSGQFLRPPRSGPVMAHVEPIKSGRTTSVLRSTLVQDDVACVEATVTTGRLPEAEPAWSRPPDAMGEPDDNAVDVAVTPGGGVISFAKHCDMRIDPRTAAFLAGRTGAPRLQLWARPRGEQPDPLFALMAADIAPPATFNLGMYGWAPTVQLTALLRARPATGWLSVSVETQLVADHWFDEDATVLDSGGRIICQARQLALAPQRPRG